MAHSALAQGPAAGARALGRRRGAEGGARRGRGRAGAGRGRARGRAAPRAAPPARAALPGRARARGPALHVPGVRGGRRALRPHRARRGHARGAGAPLLAPAARRAAVPARPRRRAPRHQAREPAARPEGRRQDIRLRHGDALQVRYVYLEPPHWSARSTRAASRVRRCGGVATLSTHHTHLNKCSFCIARGNNI